VIAIEIVYSVCNDCH